MIQKVLSHAGKILDYWNLKRDRVKRPEFSAMPWR